MEQEEPRTEPTRERPGEQVARSAAAWFAATAGPATVLAVGYKDELTKGAKKIAEKVSGKKDEQKQ